jgi:hypothetical protein
VWNKLTRKKTTFSQLSLDHRDLACRRNWRLSSSPFSNTLKGLGFRLANWDHWCSAIWPMTSSTECFLMNFHNFPTFFPLYE